MHYSNTLKDKAMIKQVNLEEILKSKLTIETMIVNNPDYTWNKTMEAMKEACKQAIELCAENSKEYADNSDVKQSILNTINQIV